MGEAVTQMDQATQQNAALVEEMAAAASSLRKQASELVAAVEVFKLPHQDKLAVGSKPAAYAASMPPLSLAAQKPAARATAPRSLASPLKTTATAQRPATPAMGGDGDWSSF